jgi:hypothetical protein
MGKETMTDEKNIIAAEIAILGVLRKALEGLDIDGHARSESENKSLKEAQRRIDRKLEDQITFKLGQLRK